MRALLLFPYYVHWHYGRALQGIKNITSNLVWFLWHFFSIGLMMSTLLEPWQRLHEERKRGLDIESYMSTLVINVIMRIVGILVRSIFIITGLVSIIITILGGIIMFAAWLILPVTVICSFVFGFILLFRVS